MNVSHQMLQWLWQQKTCIISYFNAIVISHELIARPRRREKKNVESGKFSLNTRRFFATWSQNFNIQVKSSSCAPLKFSLMRSGVWIICSLFEQLFPNIIYISLFRRWKFQSAFESIRVHIAIKILRIFLLIGKLSDRRVACSGMNRKWNKFFIWRKLCVI